VTDAGASVKRTLNGHVERVQSRPQKDALGKRLRRLLNQTARSVKAAGRFLFRYPFNLAHIVMLNVLLASIVPFYRYTGPIGFGDGALIGTVVLPAQTVTGS
jgi:hypothetical protein